MTSYADVVDHDAQFLTAAFRKVYGESLRQKSADFNMPKRI